MGRPESGYCKEKWKKSEKSFEFKCFRNHEEIQLYNNENLKYKRENMTSDGTVTLKNLI